MDNYSKTIEFKGSNLVIIVLHLPQLEIEQLLSQIKQKVQAAPQFFQNIPIVVDFSESNWQQTSQRLVFFIEKLRELFLIPVIARGLDKKYYSALQECGVSWQSNVNKSNKSNASQAASKSSEQETEQATKEASTATPEESSQTSFQDTLVVKKHIRSGQQIYAKDKHLIIIGSVNAGSEVLADGNIHIYGALMGSAHAGIRGQQDAMIFCQQLDAQVVSINGVYLPNEKIEKQFRASAVQIFSQNDQLNLSHLL